MIHNNKGFSLIETVIAIVIIGIITSMLIFLINSSNNAQKRTNANIMVFNELSNIYNAFSSLKDAESMKEFLEYEYRGVKIEMIESDYSFTLYFNSKMESTEEESLKGYKIVCLITETSSTESTHLYTLETKVFFPEETTPRELISPRTIKVGG
jgi:prepilin-type N-terminal cleavage/methylation domain-containing protein